MTGRLYSKVISITIVACLVLIISGCATTYSSIQQGSEGKLAAELIVGDEALVLDAIYRGIRKEFPTDTVMNTGSYEKGFTWYHQLMLDRTNYLLSVKKGTGMDATSNPVTGYFYTVDSNGTQVFVESRYVAPLNKAIRTTILSSDLAIVSVASVKEISFVQETHKAKTREQNCYESLPDDKELTSIKDKVALMGYAGQTFSMLVNNSKPTPEEQKALLVWGIKRDECINESRNFMDKQGTPQAIKNVVISGASTLQMLIADLYNAKLTYAEFSKKRQELNQVLNEAIANIQTELQKQSAEAKAKADQLAIQAQQNMISAYQAFNQQQQTQQMINQQQQIINQQRKPLRLETSCHFIGNAMTCY